MLVETRVLRGDGRLDQVRGQVEVIYMGTVLDMESGQQFTVLGQHLGRQLAVRVLQFLEGGDVRKGPDQQQKKHDGCDGNREDTPEPLDNYLLFFFGHTIHLWGRIRPLGRSYYTTIISLQK